MIFRIDVTPRESHDLAGEGIRRQIAELGIQVGSIRTYRIFFIDIDGDKSVAERLATDLLSDKVVEKAAIIQEAPAQEGKSRIEVHLKPGVMDPVAASTEMAIKDMGIAVRQVRTGRAYVIDGIVEPEKLQFIANRILANSVIEHICFTPLLVSEFPKTAEQPFAIEHVAIRNLTDDQLSKISRDGHLFLSLAEMQAIQSHFREVGREPTDVELETLAQTWSEHCVHKTLKSPVKLEIRDESGNTLATRQYDNLIKDTIFRATQELIFHHTLAGKPPFCLSVFVDNAGVIAFDESDAVCFKVETHNRPSAIDPYGGSATGSGGVIRDVIGTGLAAKPVANTDVFCVADPGYASNKPLLPETQPDAALPKGIIHPKRILREITAGVRDYGNRMGIPTVNGAVYFDNRYLGNPMVFCGCVGIIPNGRIQKNAKKGDAIVVIGGRTGRDGIHGATFSSAQLTTSHADEFSHAVQIGNAITEKKMTDIIMQAAELDLFNAITDCGAGGLSSAVGEMGEKIGAKVELDKAPLKYAGLKYDEIWISEAQERMVLAVSPDKVEKLLQLSKSEDVEATVIGTFGVGNKIGRPQLILTYNNIEVANIEMDFVHKGIPMPPRKAVFTRKNQQIREPSVHVEGHTVFEKLLKILAHPNVASKHWIIRQYDHEVQGGSALKPLLGPDQLGPSDASVFRPKPQSQRGVLLSCGLAPHISNPYDMAIAAIDEAIRNAVAAGADPDKLAILDNFCWPGAHDEDSMGNLAMTCQACYDASLAYGIPFISGKDSLHNQFTNQQTGEVIRIPNTLLISAIGVIEDVKKLVSMDLKTPGNKLVRVLATDNDLRVLNRMHRLFAKFMATGKVKSCHDISDGGWLTAAAEMALAGNRGAILTFTEDYFTETNGGYIVEIAGSNVKELHAAMECVAKIDVLGKVISTPTLKIGAEAVKIKDLRKAFIETLDW